ncbi:MAG: rhomboid family intramembrane serine protease [Bryobacterales bacterium]|nr:rhomboid family intramembrane serine protease [Bryobacterales bacterium]
MSYRTSYRWPSASSFFPAGVKWLLIVNIGIFLLNFFAALFRADGLFFYLGLMPAAVLQGWGVYQLFTYMFLHSVNSFGHILFNMLALWMFGADLERTWGTRRFLRFYFTCGVGAGVCVVVANALFGTLESWTIGASGAIYGLLLAFGMLFPNSMVLMSFLFPIKAKYFVAIIGAITFLSSLAAPGGSVSHVAHLGGMLVGYIYLKTYRPRRGWSRGSVDPAGSIRNWFRNWKQERAKRKFQVYLRKRDSERDRWVQ